MSVQTFCSFNGKKTKAYLFDLAVCMTYSSCQLEMLLKPIVRKWFGSMGGGGVNTN